jgi:hypothetical protein
MIGVGIARPGGRICRAEGALPRQKVGAVDVGIAIEIGLNGRRGNRDIVHSKLDSAEGETLDRTAQGDDTVELARRVSDGDVHAAKHKPVGVSDGGIEG